jgi:hypothetical protein
MPEADENMEGEEQLYEQVTDASEQAAPMEGKWGREMARCFFFGAVSLRAVCARPLALTRARLHTQAS